MATSRLRRVYCVGQAVVRVGLCFVVVYLGYVAAGGFASLLGPDPVQERATVALDAERTASAPLSVSPVTEDGYWAFAGWGWEVQQTSGSEADVEPDLAQLSPQRPRVVSEEETSLLQSLVQLDASRQLLDASTARYDLGMPPAKLVVVTKSDGDVTWISYASLAVPKGDESLGIFRLRRSDRLSGETDVAELGVIPLPEAVRRTVARVDREGKVQAELLIGCPPVRKLKPFLEQAGYSVRPSRQAAGAPKTWLVFSPSGDETFTLWNPGNNPHGIMIVSRLLAHGR